MAQDTKAAKLIFDTAYQDNLREVVSYITNNHDHERALSLYRVLNRAVSENGQELFKQPTLDAFYKESLLSLAYICLPALEDKEVESMLRHDLLFQFTLPDYNLAEKLNYKLVNIIFVPERVLVKSQFCKAVLENSETITKGYEIKTVKDWLLDYISKVGLDGQDKLAAAQYLMKLKSNKLITDQDRDKLTTIFKIYERLSLPSDTPEGFEEELNITFDGRLFVLRHGVLEPIENSREVTEALQNMATLESASESSQEPVIKSSVEPIGEPAMVPGTSQDKAITTLEAALANYPEATLEHKAIKQEISRLKSGSLRESRQAESLAQKNINNNL